MLGYESKLRFSYLGILTTLFLLLGCSVNSEINCEEYYDAQREIKTYCLEIVAILDEPLDIITHGDWIVYACRLDEECQGLIQTEGHGYGIDASIGIDMDNLADIGIYEGAIVFIIEDATVIHPLLRPGPITIINWQLVDNSSIRE